MQEKKYKKSNFFERISQIIDYYEIKNVKSFACDWLGYDSSQKINRLKDENTSPSYEILNDISNKFENINPEWLLTGKGEMLKSETSESLVPFSISEFKQRGYAPFYSEMQIGAGQYDLALTSQNIDEPASWIKIPGIEVDAWFPIVGFSMEPKIYAGDIIGVVIVHNWERIDPDKIYMVVTIYDRVIKHLQSDESEPEYIWAISENPKTKNYRLNVSEIIRIYRVVWSGRLV